MSTRSQFVWRVTHSLKDKWFKVSVLLFLHIIMCLTFKNIANTLNDGSHILLCKIKSLECVLKIFSISYN